MKQLLETLNMLTQTQLPNDFLHYDGVGVKKKKEK